MSELTQCNYCSLQDIRARAKKEGKVVTVQAGGIGFKVFTHRRDELRVPWPPSGEDSSTNQVSEMMEIPNECEC